MFRVKNVLEKARNIDNMQNMLNEKTGKARSEGIDEIRINVSEANAIREMLVGFLRTYEEQTLTTLS